MPNTEKRGLFEKIFGKYRDTGSIPYSQYKLLNTWNSTFTPYNGNAWNESAVRAAVDGFARRAAVVCPKHIRDDGNTITPASGRINYLLQSRPNPYSTAYKMFYRLAAQYKLYNNAFLYPLYGENGQLEALYLINAAVVDLLEHNNEMFVRFSFTNGQKYVCPYNEIVHVGGHFNESDVFGSANTPIKPILETATTMTQSMSKFAQLIAQIRGILKVNGAAKSEDLAFQRDRFIEQNLSVDTEGAGIVVSDSKFDYTPVNDNPTPIPAAQLAFIRNEIYSYFGTNEKIIQNKETTEEANAYYESEIKPFYVQLSQALTNALFTQKEIGFGNRVICESNRLQYEEVKNKIEAVKLLNSMGAITIDQALNIFKLPPIGGADGARRVQSLNMVSTDKIDEYQTGQKEDKEDAD